MLHKKITHSHLCNVLGGFMSFWITRLMMFWIFLFWVKVLISLIDTQLHWSFVEIWTWAREITISVINHNGCNCCRYEINSEFIQRKGWSQKRFTLIFNQMHHMNHIMVPNKVDHFTRLVYKWFIYLDSSLISLNQPSGVFFKMEDDIS